MSTHHSAPWWRRYRITTIYVVVVVTINLALLLIDMRADAAEPSTCPPQVVLTQGVNR